MSKLLQEISKLLPRSRPQRRLYFCLSSNPTRERQKHMNNTVLRADDTARALGVSRATIWNWVNPKSRHYRPDFPRPFKISANATGWLASEIDDYIGKLAAKRKEQAN